MKPETRPGARRAALALLLAPLPAALATAWWHPRAPAFAPAPDTPAAANGLSLDLPAVAALRTAPLWIDARPPAAFAADHVPGALPLTEDDWDNGFAALAAAWDGSRPLVVYCASDGCATSETIAARLRRELGSDQVFALRGGWQAWQAREAAR